MTVSKLALVALLFFTPQQSKGFALLGPFADWMRPTNGFSFPEGIGGPMDIDEEYRWNVPLLTYGFDQSFLDYFGSNGVAAVEQAFQVLNDLPPASSINLEDYSTNAPKWNSSGEANQLLDLKTATLGALLEQLGLAPPTPNVFVLRQFDPILAINSDEYLWSQLPPESISSFIFERNFDPETLLPSQFVNESHLTGSFYRRISHGVVFDDILEQLSDPTKLWGSAVADQDLSFGKFFNNLSADDAGGLKYLLHTNNVNYEKLLPDVHGATNEAYVNAAMRRGVDKITFVRQQFDPEISQWIPITNQFTDTYLTNSQFIQQALERVVTTPDFLFSMAASSTGFRTGTSNWLNHSSGSLGPGTIRPPVKIAFNNSERFISTGDGVLEYSPYIHHPHWGSFDESTNPPALYPVEGFLETNQFTIRLNLKDYFSSTSHQLEWHPNIPIHGISALQTSTDLKDWTTITTITNLGGVVHFHYTRAQSKRFFRVVPE